MEKDKQKEEDGTVNSIFVKDKNNNVFYGHCWPGTSTWVDFFNLGA